MQPSRSDILEIQGGKPLRGTVTASGNKNAVLPMIAASVLTEDNIVLENVPDIRDVHDMTAIASHLGVKTQWNSEKSELQLNGTANPGNKIPEELAVRIRASILFAGPLLARTGKAMMYPPGGDVIGRRRIDTHIEGLQQLGAQTNLGDHFEFQAAEQLHGSDIFLPEASVTATEQLLLASALGAGETIIRNAAQEPHVSDLIDLLTEMGAVIEGSGTSRLRIQGVDQLGGTRHVVSSDYTEAGSFLAIAAATGGEATVQGINKTHFRMIHRIFRQLGYELTYTENDEVKIDGRVPGRILSDPMGGIPVIDDGPWPHFPSDLMSVMLVLATQCMGTVLFFEKMYESRMYFVDRLVAMGSNAVICDPHRVVTTGPSPLHSIDLSSPDIRAGIALIGAALCAKGQTVLRGLSQVDRGYENIEAKLHALGADVKRT